MLPSSWTKFVQILLQRNYLEGFLVHKHWNEVKSLIIKLLTWNSSKDNKRESKNSCNNQEMTHSSNTVKHGEPTLWPRYRNTENVLRKGKKRLKYSYKTKAKVVKRRTCSENVITAGTRFYNVKVLKTNEQRVSKQNNHSHRTLNLHSGTHSSMRDASIFFTFKPFVVSCTISENFRAGNKPVDREER